MARKILSTITEPVIIAAQQRHVTCGIGTSIYPADNEDWQWATPQALSKKPS